MASSNRFDTATNQQYISQHVPLPLEAISGMAREQQNKYDHAIEDTYKLQDLMTNVHAIDKHQPYKQQLDAKYAPLVEDIANRISKGSDLPTAQRDMNRLARQFQADPLRQELEQSYANYGAYQKDKITKGDKYGEHYDPYLPFTGSNQDKSIAGFRYTGMGEIQPHTEEARKQMDDISKTGYFKDIEQPDAYGNVIGLKQGSEGVVDKRVRQLAHSKAPSFLLTKEGEDFSKMIRYRSPKVDIQKAAEEYLYNAGINQVGMIYKSGNSFQHAPWAAQDHADAKEQMGNKYLPTFEGNVDMTPATNKTALAKLGMDVSNIKEDGEIDFNLANISPQAAKKQLDIAKQDAERSGDYSTYQQELKNMIKYTLPKMKANDKIAVDYYSNMVRTANNVGLNIKEYTKAGKVDCKKLKADLVEAGKALETTAPSIQGFQANFAEDLSATYFGKYSDSGDGKFSVSPMFNKLAIYENNNEGTKTKIESEGTASKLAENAKFVGLDFNDKNLGSMAFVATEGGESKDPKLYNAVTSDKVMKTLMQPVHNFTQETSKALMGKQSKDELNYYKQSLIGTKDKPGALAGLMSRIENSNDPNKKAKMENMGKLMTSIYSQNQAVVMGTNNDGDKIFISQPRFEDGIPQNKVIVVNVLDGSINTQETDLGQIQNEESTNIQNKIAPAYNKQAQGYQNKNITYK